MSCVNNLACNLVAASNERVNDEIHMKFLMQIQMVSKENCNLHTKKKKIGDYNFQLND